MASLRSSPRTWRCLACLAVYVDPRADGMRYHHVCQLLGETRAARHQRPGHRDETIVQDRPGGPARMSSPGAGRALLAERDLLTEATITTYVALQTQAPLEPVPWPEADLERPRDVRPMPAEAE